MSSHSPDAPGRLRPGTRAAGGSLPAASPEECGIPSAAVVDFLDAIEQAGLDQHSLVLLRHGRVVSAGWWAPYRPTDVSLLYSLSKSFTSTAVGFAVAEGRLDLDRTLASYFPSAAAQAGPLARTIRVRHLLSMATGHQTDTLSLLDDDDPVGSFLAIEPDAEPGSLFTYHNSATLMLSALVTELTGERLTGYLRPRLLDPLGIERGYWDRWGDYDLGFSGLHLTTDAIARFGQTYLTGGHFAGGQVLPPGWAEEASAVHIRNADRSDNPDWQQGYGFQFWRARHGYRGDGAWGQFCVVLPEHDAVIAGTSATEDLQGFLDRFWQILLPAMADAPLPVDRRAAGVLAARLAGLRLPLPVTGNATAPPQARRLRFTVEGPPAQSLELAGPLTVDEDADGWSLTITQADHRYRLPCRTDSFARTEHRPEVGGLLTLASSGGWTDGGRFVADVVLLNTPHRFRVHADPETGVASTEWHTFPLGDRPLAGWALPPVLRVA